MRKIFVLLLVACVFAACGVTTHTNGSSSGHLSKAEQREQLARQVRQQLDERRYRIDVDMMYPLSYPPRHVTSDFGLEVVGDSINSYLPYLGRAYALPYGGGRGLNFAGAVSSYQSSSVGSDLTRIVFGFENEEDRYVFTIEVFDNGRATIDVRSQNRDKISFSGMLDTF